MPAFLASAFIIPHEIIMGGAAGIGILASRLLPMSAAAAPPFPIRADSRIAVPPH